MDVVYTSDGKYEADIKLSDNAYPFELYAKAIARDMSGNLRMFYLNADKSTTSCAYRDDIVPTQSSTEGTLISPAIAVPVIPYTSALCTAAAASPGTPGSVWHSFTIAAGEQIQLQEWATT